MRKNIVITGCDGFIGNHLCSTLIDNYNIIGIDRCNRNDFKNTKDFKFYKIDINDKLPDIDDVFAVVHLAARAGVRQSHKQFKDYVMDNIVGTQNIIKKCINSWNPEKILVASSSSVYGNTCNGIDGLCEEQNIQPRSPYAASKTMTEQILNSYINCGWLDYIQCASLRFFTVYGPNQRKDLAIRNFIDNTIHGKTIKIFGNGEQTRDFTYVDDICDGIQCLLKNPIAYNVYNIGSGNNISINKLIYKIALNLNREVKIKYENENVFDVMHTKADTGRMLSVGWKSKTSIDEGLKRQIEWQKSTINMVQ